MSAASISGRSGFESMATFQGLGLEQDVVPAPGVKGLSHADRKCRVRMRAPAELSFRKDMQDAVLRITLEVVQDHGDSFDCRSVFQVDEPGSAARVKICLPVHDGAPCVHLQQPSLFEGRVRLQGRLQREETVIGHDGDGRSVDPPRGCQPRQHLSHVPVVAFERVAGCGRIWSVLVASGVEVPQVKHQQMWIDRT